MGIKNLHPFLRKKCLDLYKHVHISEFAFQKISVDVSLFLYKYKIILGEKWLDAFIKLIMCLRRNEVHCVFIYDGPCPPEKYQEREKRKEHRNKLNTKIENIEKDIGDYLLNNVVSETLKEISRKNPKKKLLSKIDVDLDYINEHVEKIKNQTIFMTQDDVEKTKKLFSLLDIPYYVSAGEAETLCALLNKKDMVKGALSEDTDLLAYGTPKFIHKINTHNDTCYVLDYNEILESLELTREQFLDLCIMSGTDYNKNIPRIGNSTAYKLIKEYGNIQDIPDIDTSILNYERVREIFNQELPIPKTLFCGDPKWDELKIYLKENNSSISIEKIKKSFQPCEIIFN